MQVLMLAGDNDSLLSKHDAPQSNVVCSTSSETHGYYANLKIKIERMVLQFHFRGEGFSCVLRKCVISTKW